MHALYACRPLKRRSTIGYMDKPQNSAPFVLLGTRLRDCRERLHESLAEVAGAIEVTEDTLQRIERGAERPSEDLLMLLFNHFNTADDEAVRLWELAGYSRADLEGNDSDDDAPRDHGTPTQQIHKIMMTMTFDPRVIYSDSAQVVGNKHGLILNFMQPGASSVQPNTVSRVGMSRQQARALQHLLQDTLDQLDRDDQPKRLPPQI